MELIPPGKARQFFAICRSIGELRFIFRQAKAIIGSVIAREF
jgi:hypothetical protein